MHKRTIVHPVLADRDGLAAIGRTLHDLRGHRFNTDPGGGAPAGDPAPQPTPTPEPAPTPQPTPAAPAPAPQAPQPTPQPPVNYHGNPDDYVRELRGEAKQHREAFEREQTAHQTTQAERDTLKGRSTQLERENHLLRNAGKYGANPDLLLDSSSFMKTFADIDLSNEDAVKQAIEDALERNSAYRAGPALPPASGGGHRGGGSPTTTPTLEGAVKARLGG